jgi:hypothetical protein
VPVGYRRRCLSANGNLPLASLISTVIAERPDQFAERSGLPPEVIEGLDETSVPL